MQISYLLQLPQLPVVATFVLLVLYIFLSWDRSEQTQWYKRYKRRRMFSAIRAGQLTVIQAILRRYPEFLNEPLEEINMTPLSWACYWEQTMVVYWLRKKGAHSDDLLASKESAIYSVYQRKMPWPRKRALLDAVCADASESELGQALCLSAASGNVTACVDLLYRGANIDARNQILGLGLERTPLMLAADHRHEVIARILLANGAKPFWLDCELQEQTVMPESIRSLLERLFALGWQEEYWHEGMNPLVFALRQQNIALVSDLIQAGALPWRPIPPTGQSAWHVAKELGNSIMMDLLKDSSFHPIVTFKTSLAVVKDRITLDDETSIHQTLNGTQHDLQWKL